MTVARRVCTMCVTRGRVTREACGVVLCIDESVAFIRTRKQSYSVQNRQVYARARGGVSRYAPLTTNAYA